MIEISLVEKTTIRVSNGIKLLHGIDGSVTVMPSARFGLSRAVLPFMIGFAVNALLLTAVVSSSAVAEFFSRQQTADSTPWLAPPSPSVQPPTPGQTVVLPAGGAPPANPFGLDD